MDLGGLHVAAAAAGLGVGLAVLLRRKGGGVHVALGRLFLVLMVLVDVPVLLLYDDTGRPGPFHVLAVVSLVTTSLGWWSVRRRPRGRGGVGRHAALMTWAWTGLATAGLAQLANRQWPERSPWPVLAVVGVTTALGLVLVPRYVSRELGRPAGRSSGRQRTLGSTGRPGAHAARGPTC